MILITGSSGYIGSEIANYLEQKNIKYIGIDNHIYSSSKNIINKKKHFKIDISNNKIGKLIINPDINDRTMCIILAPAIKTIIPLMVPIMNDVLKSG